MRKVEGAKAFIVGSGIASLSAAVLLIRDGGFPGDSIRIIEELDVAGGALDGSGDPVNGYVTRGGRMWTEEAYVCLWNVLESIPTLADSARSVKEDVWAFNDVWHSDSHARLIGRGRQILDATDLGFSLRDRLELMRLLAMPERAIGAKRIEDCFSPHFFTTNFWAMWRTTFAFQNWHSAIELKRYCLRFLQEFPRIHTLAGVRRTALNQYDSVVRPMEQWLTEHGVMFEFGTRVVRGPPTLALEIATMRRRSSATSAMAPGHSGRTWRARRRDSAGPTRSTATWTRASGSPSHSRCARRRLYVASRSSPAISPAPAAS